MLAAAEAFAAANADYDISVLSGNWVAGRYMVFRMEMYTESVTQYRYFFLNLLTGEEENYQQVYANMGMDKQILSQKIYQMVDEDYQQYYEMKSGTPFNWEHNEQLYQKTMALANADGVMLIPGGEEILVYYYAYVEGNSAPVQRELHISPLHWSKADKTVAVITQGDMAMYPGLDQLFEGNFSTNPDVGYLNYGVWQCDDVVVIGIGWYDSNMNWCGYETLCINETSHKTVDFYGVLSNAGMDGQTFENQLRTYLESQPDFPG